MQAMQAELPAASNVDRHVEIAMSLNPEWRQAFEQYNNNSSVRDPFVGWPISMPPSEVALVNVASVQLQILQRDERICALASALKKTQDEVNALQDKLTVAENAAQSHYQVCAAQTLFLFANWEKGVGWTAEQAHAAMKEFIKESARHNTPANNQLRHLMAHVLNKPS